MRCQPRLLSPVLGGILAVICADLPHGFLFAQAQPVTDSGTIQAEVKGSLRRTPGAAGIDVFRINAGGRTWELDVSASTALRQTAETIAGGVAIAAGTYTESGPPAARRRVLTVRTLRAATANGRGEYIDVVVKGRLKTGVVAIGGETSGVTITAGRVTWELDLDRRQLSEAARLSGTSVTVTGRLTLKPGVELGDRPTIQVSRINPE